MKKPAIRKLAMKPGLHFKKDDSKLTELVVLLAERSKSDPLFGGIKLNKLLFYCDFYAYAMFGAPITGQEYFALENGPALRRKAVLWNKMERQRDIAVKRSATSFDNEREVTLALRDPDVSKFSSQELDLIYRVLEAHRGKSGTDLSAESHRFIGWELAREKETIPYPVALVGTRKPTPAEQRVGLEIERALCQAAA